MNYQTLTAWVEGQLYPRLKERFSMRKADADLTWYISPRDGLMSVYGLVWDAPCNRWRVTNISGDEHIRASIEQEILEYENF